MAPLACPKYRSKFPWKLKWLHSELCQFSGSDRRGTQWGKYKDHLLCHLKGKELRRRVLPIDITRHVFPWIKVLAFQETKWYPLCSYSSAFPGKRCQKDFHSIRRVLTGKNFTLKFRQLHKWNSREIPSNDFLRNINILIYF